MDIRCPRCGNQAIPAGHEDARAFFRCEKCNRVWVTHLTAATTGRLPGATPRMRVLVVDDSDQLVELIAAWLEGDDYEVWTATTGSGAIEEAAAHSPDIVLLDLIIPPPDGFAVCERLMEQPHPPVIVLMTGTSDPLRLQTAQECNVFAFLLKPLTEEVVLDAVSRARRRRWQETQLV